MAKHPGQPKKITPQILQVLREAFLMGLTDEQACIYAHISPATLYNYQKHNPEYLEQKSAYKLNMLIRAKFELSGYLTGQKPLKPAQKIQLIKWYLERKDKVGFSRKFEYEKKITDSSVLRINSEQYTKSIIAAAKN